MLQREEFVQGRNIPLTGSKEFKGMPSGTERSYGLLILEFSMGCVDSENIYMMRSALAFKIDSLHVIACILICILYH